MNDLRKAAEMALEALEWNYGTDLENIENCTAWLDKLNATIPALRQALSEEALNMMVAENQRLGLYDEDNLQTAIERGTKAWADVPDATEWVEELRGNDTPEVTPDVDKAYTKNDTKAGVLHKEWVGLSEDEFEKILETHNEAMPFAVIEAIEAKLKEKNA